MNTENANRVLRGGSWVNPADFARAASRVSYNPGYRGYRLGFRLSRSINLLQQLSELNNEDSSHT